MAAQNNHFEVVNALIKHKVLLNKCKLDGSTPLYIAAEKGNTEIIKLLLQAGARYDAAFAIGSDHSHAFINSVNTSKHNGATPLYIACENGHTSAIPVLIAAGANVNAVMDDYATPLFIAAQNGHTEAVSLLLKAGADRSIAWKGTITPLLMAKRKKYQAIIDLLQAN
jgi:ankyrin repeat protein